MNTNGTYLEYVIPVCPQWPNSSSPDNEKDAIRASQWGGGTVVSPCEWRHDKQVEHAIPNQPLKAHIMIRIISGQLRSSAAKQNLKYMYCKTHGVYATKTYVKGSGFQAYVSNMLRQWWDFKVEYKMQTNGYTMPEYRAYRKILIDTMRKMW